MRPSVRLSRDRDILGKPDGVPPHRDVGHLADTYPRCPGGDIGPDEDRVGQVTAAEGLKVVFADPDGVEAELLGQYDLLAKIPEHLVRRPADRWQSGEYRETHVLRFRFVVGADVILCARGRCRKVAGVRAPSGPVAEGGGTMPVGTGIAPGLRLGGERVRATLPTAVFPPRSAAFARGGFGEPSDGNEAARPDDAPLYSTM